MVTTRRALQLYQIQINGGKLNKEEQAELDEYAARFKKKDDFEPCVWVKNNTLAASANIGIWRLTILASRERYYMATGQASQATSLHVSYLRKRNHDNRGVT